MPSTFAPGAESIKPADPTLGEWAREFWRRFTAQAWLKGFGIPGFMALFMLGYFLIAFHPAFPVTVIPETALDRIIGFQPWALGFYVSLWVYVSLAPGLIDDRRELLDYAFAALCMSAVGLAVMFLWPTATPQSAVDWARYPAYDFLKNADDARNACPSLHVAFSVFSGIWIDRVLRRMRTRLWIRGLNALWALGIVYSTLATKQHVVLDVAVGAVLGWETSALLRHFLRRRETRAAAGTVPTGESVWEEPAEPDPAD